MTETLNDEVAELRRANAELQRRLDAALAERDEAAERETATAEVLQVINSSSGNLTPVFDTMLEKAMRLCEAAFGLLQIREGNHFRTAATRGVPAAFADFRKRNAPIEGPGSLGGRIMAGERIVHVVDLKDDEPYRAGDVNRRALVDIGGGRTGLAVALVRDESIRGFIIIYRQDVRPFADQQIALLQNFAAQAVIAMENARLITETREALEQQTATAEVLQVINASPGDLAPVFDAVLDKAVRLCEGSQGLLWTLENDSVRCAAMFGVTAEYAAFLKRGIIPGPKTPMARLLRGERVVEILDLAEDEGYQAGDPVPRAAVEIGGIRSMVFVALLSDETLVGAFAVARSEVRPFTDKQIALLENFAVQAVIAIENARLLGELRERTDDLQESLEYQTATSDVLKVISRSTFDLQPVLDTLAETAARLCDAGYTAIFRRDDGEVYRIATVVAFSPETMEAALKFQVFLEQHPLVPGRGSIVGRVALEGRAVHVADTASDPEYILGEAKTLGNIRTQLGVPLLREGEPIGVIILARQRVQPFTEGQIELVRTFADQAVIALENARLLGELRERTDDLQESLEYQTATSDVLKVISRSTFDLQPVLDTLLETATRLCGADFGGLNLREGEATRVAASFSHSPEFDAFIRGRLLPPGRGNVAGRVVLEGKVVQITDVASDPEFTITEVVTLGKIRTMLGVPLLREGVVVGAIILHRQRVQPFTDRQIELVRTFADQAVIAMENARLITETREALDQQTATAEVLQVINSSPGELSPVFEAMLDKAMRLCEASFGAFMSFDGDLFHRAAHRGLPIELVEDNEPLRPIQGSALARIVGGESVVHIHDLSDTDAYRAGYLGFVRLVEQGGARTAIWMALRKDGTLLGVAVIYRQEVRPFTDKQIGLLQNFAAQAVIAMENARLITETREALEQQTATAEVLQVINSSLGDLAPVFDAMLDKAIRLCGAAFGIMNTYDGNRFDVAATRGVPAEAEAILRSAQPSTHGVGARVLGGQDIVAIEDFAASPAYLAGAPRARALVDLGGVRSYVGGALRKDDRLLGTIGVYRQEVRPFSDKEIALLQNFAAQAVIAMENARLITETREALDQQTATSEVLQVINASPGDLAPVFEAMLEKALQLCGATFGFLSTYQGDDLHQAVAMRTCPNPLRI